MSNIRSLAMALAFSAAAFVGTGSLQAAYAPAQKVKVDFDFRVYQKVLPAGEYRVEQDTASNIVLLVNTKTGQRVQIFRSVVQESADKHYLKFEHDQSGYRLRW